MENYTNHLSNFDDHLTLKNFSKATRSAYGCALRQFFKYREKHGMSGPFDQDQAKQYVLYRYNRGLKWQTINGDYSAMRKFYREVMNLEWSFKKLPRPRKERSLPMIISKEEVQKLIESTNVFKFQVFISFLYGTGMRLGETLQLKISHIDGHRKQIRIERGKGAKDRYIQIPDCLLVLLRQYYTYYRPLVFLFNGKIRGKPWSQRAAQWSIKKACESAGVQRPVSPHTFRHCYATHHLESGTDLVFLQQQLGHKHLKTTARYIHLCKTRYQQINHPIASMQIRYRIPKV